MASGFQTLLTLPRLEVLDLGALDQQSRKWKFKDKPSRPRCKGCDWRVKDPAEIPHPGPRAALQIIVRKECIMSFLAESVTSFSTLKSGSFLYATDFYERRHLNRSLGLELR